MSGDDRSRLTSIAAVSLLAGAGGMGAAASLAAVTGKAFWHPYMFAFVTCLGVPLGAAIILMTHHLTGGRWGWPVRRLLEGGVLTLPLFALFFVPVAVLGMDALYFWTDEGSAGPGHPSGLRESYLNQPFFFGRAAFYFTTWILIAWFLAHRGARESPDHRREPRKLPRLAAAGLVLYFLTITFASFDWLMTLQERWYSSVFGAYTIIGHVLTAMCLVTIAVTSAVLRTRERGNEHVQDTVHDLGNLLFTLVVLYAYLSFAQFFIIWNGNLPHHVTWYIARTEGAWAIVAQFLIAGEFGLPIALLLFRAVKRRPGRLLAVASWVLMARVIDSAWIVLPSLPGTGFVEITIAAGCLLGIAGVWSAAFVWQCHRMMARVPGT